VYRCLRQAGGNFPVCLQIVVERLATQSGSRVSVQRVQGRSIEMIRTTVAHLKASYGGGKVSVCPAVKNEFLDAGQRAPTGSMIDTVLNMFVPLRSILFLHIPPLAILRYSLFVVLFEHFACMYGMASCLRMNTRGDDRSTTTDRRHRFRCSRS
jgi:hypothetical protein